MWIRSQKFMGKFRVNGRKKKNHLLRHKDRIESDQVCSATWKMGRRNENAIISDIHANIEALESVLTDIKRQKADEIICLGRYCRLWRHPNECIDLVKKSCSLIILGNHDAAAIGLLSTDHFNVHAKIAIDWTAENLSPDSQSFYGRFRSGNKYSHAFVHATPYEPNMWYYITSLEEAAFNFQFFETVFCFVGHTHIPIIIVLEMKKKFMSIKATK